MTLNIRQKCHVLVLESPWNIMEIVSQILSRNPCSVPLALPFSTQMSVLPSPTQPTPICPTRPSQIYLVSSRHYLSNPAFSWSILSVIVILIGIHTPHSTLLFSAFDPVAALPTMFPNSIFPCSKTISRPLKWKFWQSCLSSSDWGGSSPASLPLPFLGWSWCTIHTGPHAVLCPDIPRDAVRVPWCCCSPLQVSFQKQTVLGNASSRYSGALLHGNGKTLPKDWAIQQEFEFGILSIVMEQIQKTFLHFTVKKYKKLMNDF